MEMQSLCFSPNTACLVALLSGTAQDTVQSKNNHWPCLAVLYYYFFLSNLSRIAVWKCACMYVPVLVCVCLCVHGLACWCGCLGACCVGALIPRDKADDVEGVQSLGLS